MLQSADWPDPACAGNCWYAPLTQEWTVHGYICPSALAGRAGTPSEDPPLERPPAAEGSPGEQARAMAANEVTSSKERLSQQSPACPWWLGGTAIDHIRAGHNESLMKCR